MEPTIVYKKGGKHRGPKNINYSYMGVSDEAELKKLLADGWYECLFEAVGILPKKKKEEVKEEPVVVKKPKVSFQDAPKSEEASVEVRTYSDLSDEEKKDIGRRLLDGEKPGTISKDYDVHHLTIVKVKRELD